jgi:hypothetical protein
MMYVPAVGVSPVICVAVAAAESFDVFETVAENALKSVGLLSAVNESWTARHELHLLGAVH